MSASAATGQKHSRILVACIGNIFLGDDGFGVEVARRLAGRQYPDGVEVVDFGIRGVDLAYTLLDGYETLVLVDAVPRGGAPGTLYLIEPEIPATGIEREEEMGGIAVDTHSMNPVKVLAFARTLGARPHRVLLIGCEPARLAGDGDDLNLHMGLSEPMQAVIDEAVSMIDSLLERLLAEPDGDKHEPAPSWSKV